MHCMKTVGLKTLKNKLSEYVRVVLTYIDSSVALAHLFVEPR